MSRRTLVWFRGKDLRIADHAPLRAALETHGHGAGEVIPLFVLDDHFLRPDAARRTPHRIQFLLDSLESLSANLAHLGSTKEIAARLNIAVHTVKSHVHNVLEKLALHSRLEVAAFSHSGMATRKQR